MLGGMIGALRMMHNAIERREELARRRRLRRDGQGYPVWPVPRVRPNTGVEAGSPRKRTFLTGRRCPRCACPMELIGLRGSQMDFCPECLGIWSGMDMLDILPGEDRKVLLGRARTRPSRFRCPACGGAMRRYSIGDPDLLWVDVCVADHGVYFDGGELAKVLHMSPSDALPDRGGPRGGGP